MACVRTIVVSALFAIGVELPAFCVPAHAQVRARADIACKQADGPFDVAWMHETFEGYWAYARSVVEWTNALLTPPPEHVMQLLGAASQNDAVAHRFVNGFDDPRDFDEWFMDPAKAGAYLAEVLAA